MWLCERPWSCLATRFGVAARTLGAARCVTEITGAQQLFREYNSCKIAYQYDDCTLVRSATAFDAVATLCCRGLCCRGPNNIGLARSLLNFRAPRFTAALCNQAALLAWQHPHGREGCSRRQKLVRAENSDLGTQAGFVGAPPRLRGPLNSGALHCRRARAGEIPHQGPRPTGTATPRRGAPARRSERPPAPLRGARRARRHARRHAGPHGGARPWGPARRGGRAGS